MVFNVKANYTSAFLIAFILLMNGCSSPSTSKPAPESYTETSLALSQDLAEGSKVIRLIAHDDGSLDYFVQSSLKKSLQYSRFFSPDGGETWQEKDMRNVEMVREQLKAKIMDFHVDDSDRLYCILKLGQDIPPEKKDTFGSTYAIYKFEDEVSTKIWPLSEISLDLVDHRFAGLTDKGDLLVFHYALDVTEIDSILDEIDPEDGTIKKTYQIKKPFLPKASANGVAFGQRYESGEYLVVSDLESGSEKVTIDIENLVNQSNVFDLCAQENGTAYIISESGLYQLTPDSTELVRLIDGTLCRFSNNAWCDAVDCTNDGTFYAILSDLDRRTNSDTSHTQLYRYQVN